MSNEAKSYCAKYYLKCLKELKKENCPPPLPSPQFSLKKNRVYINNSNRWKVLSSLAR